MIAEISAKIVSIGSVSISASNRGTTSIRVGERPSASSASICSVTTIEPSSAAIAAPARPATTTAVSIGPSSRTVGDRASDERRKAVADGLHRGLERDDGTGEERGQQYDRPRIHPEQVRLVDRLLSPNREAPGEVQGFTEEFRNAAGVLEKADRLAACFFEELHLSSSSSIDERTPCVASTRRCATPRSAVRLNCS